MEHSLALSLGYPESGKVSSGADDGGPVPDASAYAVMARLMTAASCKESR